MIEHIGERYGRLVIIRELQPHITPSGKKERIVLCECDCGSEKSVMLSALRSGNTVSCGCLRSEKSSERRLKAKSDMAKTGSRLYRIWREMKRRCYKQYDPSYKYYGGRGIKICDEWVHDINIFVEWSVSNGYADDLSIDRIDSDGDYCPENCRWVDYKTQNNHTSRNHYITYNNETLTIKQWSEKTGISYNALKSRLNKHGWSIERALTTP